MKKKMYIMYVGKYSSFHSQDDAFITLAVPFDTFSPTSLLTIATAASECIHAYIDTYVCTYFLLEALEMNTPETTPT